MPIYRYRCKKCNKEFEFLHKSVSAKEEVVCPQCGSKDVERLLSTFSVGNTSLDGGTSFGGSCPTCCPGGTCGLS